MRHKFSKIDINKLKMLINVIITNRKKNMDVNNKTKIYDFFNETKKEMIQIRSESINLNVNNKILVIVSCHTQGKLRWDAINTIMNYLSRIENIDIVIVNSSDLPSSDNIKKLYSEKCIKYMEIPNDNFYGFSKWYYALENIDYSNYKFVTFINDSILVHSDITHFFDFTRFKNVDLFGYNDSNQRNYHYQSYLFSIKQECIDNFKKMYNDYKHLIHSYNDVVNYYELQMLQYFDSKDCFLKLTEIDSQNGKNIFFNNDNLYLKIRDQGYLPFTKLKRIQNN